MINAGDPGRPSSSKACGVDVTCNNDNYYLQCKYGFFKQAGEKYPKCLHIITHHVYTTFKCVAPQ
jgi:hypothetical protein